MHTMNALFSIVHNAVAAALLLIVALAPAAPARAEAPLLVFAAASTTDAMSKLADVYQAQGGAPVKLSFASSSTLAKQIAQGAPAAVYVSANEKWMDYVQGQGLLEPGSRRDLLANSLVLIAPAASPLGPVELRPGLDLAALLGDGRLALGDPAHVPAGMYAKAALVNLGLWPQVAGRIAPAADVRRALAMVELGEMPLGMVYSTDAQASDKVKVLGAAPAGSHKPIVYPAALVKGAGAEAARFLEFLGSRRARAVWAGFGFKEP